MPRHEDRGEGRCRDLFLPRGRHCLLRADEKFLLRCASWKTTQSGFKTKASYRVQASGQPRPGGLLERKQRLRRLPAKALQTREILRVACLPEVLGGRRQGCCDPPEGRRITCGRTSRDGGAGLRAGARVVEGGGRRAHETTSRVGSGKTSLPPRALKPASRSIMASRKCHGST